MKEIRSTNWREEQKGVDIGANGDAGEEHPTRQFQRVHIPPEKLLKKEYKMFCNYVNVNVK
ncbi:hypothetical protein DEO72_LG6g2044 [Vigna unguiculata]|uniref:Uncharacterized protein n=1 Tax=Vigna unguiculata TaxID=3917 RepID=A0A4D6MC33_VIGUN|nr:hypothetical protein DEO72_LG6g2044 [Vigna unguiculata]